MLNPYANVDFSTANRVQSVSHAHGRDTLRWGYLYEHGIRHFAMSNYHPSEPYYPLADYWADAPQGILSAPNAEYYDFRVSPDSITIFPLHANGLGCTYVSDGVYQTYSAGFKTILNTLIVPDGGGITINHPKYSGTPLNSTKICSMLDVDDRVLGLEIYNSNEQSPLSDGVDSTDIWDEVLKTGRRCWGFGVPDWAAYGGSNWKGRNILLVSELTDVECLKAYREGRFYVAYFGDGLTFESFQVSENDMSVSTNDDAEITIITDFGRYVMQGKSASLSFPQKPIFVRVEATDGTERIMSQPVMIKKIDNIQTFITVLS